MGSCTTCAHSPSGSRRRRVVDAPHPCSQLGVTETARLMAMVTAVEQWRAQQYAPTGTVAVFTSQVTTDLGILPGGILHALLTPPTPVPVGPRVDPPRRRRRWWLPWRQ